MSCPGTGIVDDAVCAFAAPSIRVRNRRQGEVLWNFVIAGLATHPASVAY
ncbi:hypothetical protein [Pseudoruegeria sp. SK021]|nr:hypothetical protein [Pseudoruegeria sp. SK021]